MSCSMDLNGIILVFKVACMSKNLAELGSYYLGFVLLIFFYFMSTLYVILVQLHRVMLLGL